MNCHEILLDPKGKQWVCEATRYTEHTHGDLMSYMRPLKSTEQTRLNRQYDYRYLVTKEA